mmetsp:Transcript_23581/g.52235  ORF Transcript_23581/g.52235 Transcript_23581/m.52235 type:complete len:151 (+) Transcript_23581:68-520(+)
MGHAYKHKVAKAEFIKWLLTWDYALLKDKSWASIKNAWQRSGGDVWDLRFLDNKQHALHVWQVVSSGKEPKESKSQMQLRVKQELMYWLWYYDNEEFWQELGATSKFKSFLKRLRQECERAGWKLPAFLCQRDHCKDIYRAMFYGAKPKW